MFIDWNRNGRRNDSFDNLMDFILISNLSKGGKNNNNGRGCCGTCCLYLLLFPAGIAGLIYGISKLLS